jgi:hypothetical protein
MPLVEPEISEGYPANSLAEISTIWGGKSVGDAQLIVDAYRWYQYHKMMSRMAKLNNYGILDTNHATYAGHLEPTNPAGTTLRLASGIASVYYHLYTNDANIDFSLAYHGYYRLVLRSALKNQTVRAFLLGPSTVDWPTYFQTNDVFDLPICRAHSTGAAIDILYDDRRFARNLSIPRRQGDSVAVTDWQDAGTATLLPQKVMIQFGSALPGSDLLYGKNMGGTIGNKAMIFTCPFAYDDPSTTNIVVTDSIVTHGEYTTAGGVTDLEAIMWTAFYDG